jgi:hypothetical protein
VFLASIDGSSWLVAGFRATETASSKAQRLTTGFPLEDNW